MRNVITYGYDKDGITLESHSPGPATVGSAAIAHLSKLAKGTHSGDTSCRCKEHPYVQPSLYNRPIVLLSIFTP